MMNTPIIEVAFADKYHPGEYSARTYAYICKFPVMRLTKLKVPTVNGEGNAMVIRTGLTLDDVPMSVRPYLRTIDTFVPADEETILDKN